MFSMLSRLRALSARRAVRRRGYSSATYIPTAIRWKPCRTNAKAEPSSLLGVHKELCLVSQMHTTSQYVDPLEMKKFQAWSAKWWDEEGVYSALHSMNDIRVPFVRDILMSKSFNHDVGCPLSGVTILDVGCGGGLLSEPLARLGAAVTGIDPLEDNIRTAQMHKSSDPILDKAIQYKSCWLEELVEGNRECFDAVVASEVLEHVVDIESFIQSCFQILKPGGSLIITTINKTKLSYALAIVLAENIMGIVPKGTHDWEKFIPPVELERILESNGYVVETLRGILYNPLSGSWSWIDDTSINYAMHAVKTLADEEPTGVDLENKDEWPKAAEASG
ncbi:ubiquinone biosynthesis O-methyltransferase, mitochondrial [Spea bombifrons]|uniref:ubiquinone biosynthesis O-methyltransferase, mitochondrial n=1 Tax=Spea bombifrons TaxID=233779 RepID=UPI0023499B0B|nr:ubiquinone biosynthesis O-methyltransferase, mitochondrial [Spea bombifrons]